MKSPVLIVAVALGLGVVFTVAAPRLRAAGKAVSAQQSDPDPPAKLLLAVRGLSCGACEKKIQQALRRDPAVKTVAVDIGGGTVAVEYLPGAVDPKALADTVTGLGYRAEYLASGLGAAAPIRAGGRATSSGCNGGCCSETRQRIAE